MSKLDELQERWKERGWEIHPNAIKDIKALMLELIGEDDFITKPSGNSRFDQQVHLQIDGANNLKAELRQKVEEL